MTYRFAGLISEADIQDAEWDDIAEADCAARYSEAIPVPAEPRRCGCGAMATGAHCDIPFCKTCYDLLVVCCACDHAGTPGDFNQIFDDEVIEMCPMCGGIETARERGK